MSQCKDCGGSGICQHGRERSQCKDCGGSSICEHGRRKSACKDCGGGSICEHGRVRSRCKDCGGSSGSKLASGKSPNLFASMQGTGAFARVVVSAVPA